jgi:lactoylglutathione lyase
MNILELKLKFRKIDEEHGEEFAFLELKGGNLELLTLLDENNNKNENKATMKANCPHIALRVENLDETIKKLTEKGVDILKGPLEIANEVKWLYIRDPDLNIIELVEWIDS